MTRNGRTGQAHGLARVIGATLLAAPLLAACSSNVATPAASTATSAPSPAASPAESPAASPGGETSPSPVLSQQPLSTPAVTPRATLPINLKSAIPLFAPCGPTKLHAAIVQVNGVYWDGAAGARGATFRITNTGTTPCSIRTSMRPQLVNGNGVVLINGGAPSSAASVLLAAGGTLTTTVQTSNLCKAPAIVAPVRVAFVTDVGSITADPASASDTGGVPPCLGDPAVASGSIQMQDWR